MTAVIKPARNTPMRNVQYKTPDDGQRKCPKHVELFDKIKFGKFVRLVGLIKKKFVTMHGHMTVKSCQHFAPPQVCVKLLHLQYYW
jgi:hypothetical protein